MIRKQLLRRPLLSALALYLLVIFLLLYGRFVLPTGVLVGLMLIPLLLALTYCPAVSGKLRASHKTLRLPLLLLTLSLLVSSLTATTVNRERTDAEVYFDSRECRATLVIERVAPYSEGVTLYGSLSPDTAPDTVYRAVITVFGEAIVEEKGGGYTALMRGDTFSGVFELSSVTGDTLGELWQYADGYDLVGTYREEGICLSHGHRSLATFTDALRQKLSALLEETLGENGRTMMKALLLADKSEIPVNVKSGFTTLGISHLLAVSGLHLAIVMGFVSALLDRFSLGRRIAYPLLCLITLFYITVTGFAPSMLRSGGMLLLFYLSYYVRRNRDTVTSLFIATAVIVALSPRAILDAGLLLSFLSTLGILTLASFLLSRLKATKLYRSAPTRLREALRTAITSLLSATVTTFSATVMITPILYLMSGEIFLLSPLSNLIFAPFFTLLLYLMPLYLLALPIPFVAKGIPVLIELVSAVLFRLAEVGEALSPLSYSLNYGFVPYLLAGIAILALLLFAAKRTRLAIVSLALVFFLIPIGIAIDNSILTERETLAYYTDGKNDLVSVSFEDRRMLVVFSASGNFIKRTVDSAEFDTPSVRTDTLLLSEIRPTHIPLIRELSDSGDIRHLIIPANTEYSLYLESYAKHLGFSVTLYTPNDGICYNGITITTYAADGKTVAASFALEGRSLLYLKENAPNAFDIRFGVMQEHHDTVILGCYGGTLKGTLYLSADTVWEYQKRGYVVPLPHQTLSYGNASIAVYRSEGQDKT
ncbi:MAG: ComEC/Rec2 family competence protein [Clostridia bacterium]|nr:ComEC/Rec2 family competence protein [Clostridia bacterium]